MPNGELQQQKELKELLKRIEKRRKKKRKWSKRSGKEDPNFKQEAALIWIKWKNRSNIRLLIQSFLTILVLLLLLLLFPLPQVHPFQLHFPSQVDPDSKILFRLPPIILDFLGCANLLTNHFFLKFVVPLFLLHYSEPANL